MTDPLPGDTNGPRTAPSGDCQCPSWPTLRSDLAAVVSTIALFVCLATHTWPVLAGTALLGVLFCAIVPRMRRKFTVKGPGVEIVGELRDDDPELP